jgi:DNA-binding IscR family transcriptional regulator
MTRCGGEAAKPCLAGQRCLTHGLWDALGEQIAAFLESVTLQEVLDGIPSAKQAVRGERAVVPPIPVPTGHVIE